MAPVPGVAAWTIRGVRDACARAYAGSAQQTKKSGEKDLRR
ncbi:hypothetical protein C7S13_4017 [Burkholderia cepacia]|nr:hypothetical protein [Burkholderia cepacia]MDW9247741.1 hypothetical protein [Burkholderia cepacia]